VVLLITGKHPGIKAPLVLVVMFFLILLTVGMSLFMAVAYISFDDSKSLIAILLLMLQYMTPVFYPISVLGPHTLRVIKLNPLTAFLTVFRDVFGNNGSATLGTWAYMVASSLVIFIGGLYFFMRKWPKVVAKL
jgi:ABC-type polysaccharide/polyol phosphate export permease